MEKRYAIFLDSIKCFLKDEKIDSLKNADGTDLKNLYRISFSYDLMQIAYYALKKNNTVNDGTYYPLIFEGYIQAISRAENLSYDLTRVRDALNGGKVPFIALKGAVMRELYREDFYRTCSDVDVLIKKEDVDKADRILTKNLSFKFRGGSGHDRLYRSPSGTNLELHFTLLEEGMAGNSFEVLNSVWDNSFQADTGEFIMSEGFFYLFHVAHMAKHFENGTLGIRPFIDLYILNQKGYREQAKGLIEKAGLEKFTDCVEKLSRVWFDGEVHDELTQKTEGFILDGGAFGNPETKMAVNTRRAGGGRKYILSRIFLPYRKLKSYYPKLEKHKWLMPYYEVKRWFRLLFKGKRRVAVRDLKLAGSVNVEKGNEHYELCKSLGIGR